MARKRKQAARTEVRFIDFSFEQRTYQIDPDMNKVYRRFVEIETSKASQILSTWRANLAGV